MTDSGYFSQEEHLALRYLASDRPNITQYGLHLQSCIPESVEDVVEPFEVLLIDEDSDLGS
jgi:hypothetical protein